MTLAKPSPWNWSVEALAPEFRGIASRARFLLPYWEGRGAGAPIDLIQGLKGTPTNTPIWVSEQDGSAHRFEGLNESYTYGSQSFHATSEPGVFWYGAINEDVTTVRPAFELSFTSASEPFYEISLRYNNGAFPRFGNVQWNQGGVRKNFDALAGAAGQMPLNKLSTWIVSIRDGEQKLWINNLLIGTLTNAGTVTNYNQPTNVNKSDVVNIPGNNTQSLLLLVEGGFSQAEADLLHADPFGIIRRDEDLAKLAAGGVNTPQKRFSMLDF